MYTSDESQVGVHKTGVPGAGLDGGARPRNGFQSKVIAAAVALAAAAIVVAGCAAGQPATGGAVETARPGPAPVAAIGCVSEPRTVRTGGWEGQQPVARSLSHDPVPIRGFVTGNSNDDRVTATHAVLDFAPAPRVPGVDPADTITLIEITANLVEPRPWRTSEIMLVAYAPSPGHPDWIAPRCAQADPGLLAAMRDSGHPPLPDQINPGQQMTGWVAFAVPSDTKVLTISLRRTSADGSSSWTEGAILDRSGPQ